MNDQTIIYLLVSVIVLFLLFAAALWLIQVWRKVSAKGRQWLEDEGYIPSAPSRQLRKKLDDSYSRLAKN